MLNAVSGHAARITAECPSPISAHRGGVILVRGV